jgi:hypothetical protein
MEKQGSGYDFGLALSGSSSASSGQQVDFRNFFGDLNVGGGAGLPKWALPLIILAAFGMAIVWIVRR